jgi:hypothetical protein
VQRLLDAEAKSCESEAKASLADLQKEKAIQVWKFTAIFFIPISNMLPQASLVALLML